MPPKTSWTVASRLRLLSIMIVLSGILGVVGALQITKCAKMHELNSLHLKHNYLFSHELASFHDDETYPAERIREHLVHIRQQPVDCLGILGLMERAVISAVGTYEAITICENDLQLADRTLAALDAFESGSVSRAELVVALREAEEGFNRNSVDFEPLVERTVDAVSSVVTAFVILKAIFVGLCGWLMARSVGGDYRKLVEAEESLERTNSELQNFVYRTSHDFKSPLLGIRSMAYFLEEDIRDGKLDEALSNVERIKKNVDALEGVVTSTLQLAKTDLAANRSETVELRALLGEIRDKLASFAEQRGVAIRIKDRVAGTTIETDGAHLKAAIENLVSNGIKYSREDRPDSFVEIDATRGPSGDLRLVVEDNGIGIPEEYQAEAFDMFKQFHPERSEGSGLGLYIVKRSVARLSGSISLESERGRTCATIVIPALSA